VAIDKDGNPYKMNGRVQAPKYYWKAICNPYLEQSIVFVGINSVGSKSTKKIKGCNGVEQTDELGIMFCDSLENIKNNPEYSDFLLPPFNEATCKASKRGTFLDDFVNFK